MTDDFHFGLRALNARGYNCCGKPQGCTNQNPGCAYLRHPYKRWVRGEITLAELQGTPAADAHTQKQRLPVVTPGRRQTTEDPVTSTQSIPFTDSLRALADALDAAEPIPGFHHVSCRYLVCCDTADEMAGALRRIGGPWEQDPDDRGEYLGFTRRFEGGANIYVYARRRLVGSTVTRVERVESWECAPEVLAAAAEGTP